MPGRWVPYNQVTATQCLRSRSFLLCSYQVTLSMGRLLKRAPGNCKGRASVDGQAHSRGLGTHRAVASLSVLKLRRDGLYSVHVLAIDIESKLANFRPCAADKQHLLGQSYKCYCCRYRSVMFCSCH